MWPQSRNWVGGMDLAQRVLFESLHYHFWALPSVKWVTELFIGSSRSRWKPILTNTLFLLLVTCRQYCSKIINVLLSLSSCGVIGLYHCFCTIHGDNDDTQTVPGIIQNICIATVPNGLKLFYRRVHLTAGNSAVWYHTKQWPLATSSRAQLHARKLAWGAPRIIFLFAWLSSWKQ